MSGVRRVQVRVHRDAEASWWAEATSVPGWTAAAATDAELQALVTDGLEFHLEEPVEVEWVLDEGLSWPVRQPALHGRPPGDSGLGLPPSR